jgi:hypothetical protein
MLSVLVVDESTIRLQHYVGEIRTAMEPYRNERFLDVLMRRLRQFLRDTEAELNEDNPKVVDLSKLSLALEHQTYKPIPGTQNSFRLDPANTSTMTQRHAHVYAQPGGKGRELYSVNLDGSGHDGSSGTAIPPKHAEFLRSKGFDIPTNLVLESLDYDTTEFNFFAIIEVIDES